MINKEKTIKELESLRDICNAKSDIAAGKGKIVWAGYANAAEDALALLKEQKAIRQCKDCKFYAGTHPEFAMCSELDICVDSDFYCKYWRTEGR